MSGNLIDLRSRISSVKNTQKITKAMKTVSAVKLRKSVMEINRSHPVLSRLESLIFLVRKSAGLHESPLLTKRSSGEIIIVPVSADKGLCGSFNSNLAKRTEAVYKKILEEGGTASFVPVGRKIGKFLIKKGYEIRKNFPDLMARLNFNDSAELTEYLRTLYLSGDIKEVRFVFTGFRSASTQELSERTLFPVALDTDPDDREEVEYIFEPEPSDILDLLIPKYVNSHVYHTLLESSASEHAARMSAMELATRNASEMIQRLTLTMNKLRQASITKELLEIITATEALMN